MKLKSYLLLIVWLILCVIIISCGTDIDNYKRPKTTVSGSKAELDTLSPIYDTKLQIYSFQGCEYLVEGEGHYRWGSHKGNCKNPIHSKN